MIIINLLLLKIVMNDMIAICNGFFKTSATARQTQETEKKFINAYSILYIFTKLL